MKLSTHRAKSRFNLIAEAYDLQGDEEIIFIVIMFCQAVKLKFEPSKRVLPHFTFRLFL